MAQQLKDHAIQQASQNHVRKHVAEDRVTHAVFSFRI
jgi:hypothetical protein